jgi:hypothetical protein
MSFASPDARSALMVGANATGFSPHTNGAAKLQRKIWHCPGVSAAGSVLI